MTKDPPNLSMIDRLKRPPWRTVVPAATVLLVIALSYLLWSPGAYITDGRHDRGDNAVWLQHGWLGDDGWFERNNKIDRITDFRSRDKLRALASLMRDNHIRYLYPHLAPTMPDGRLPPVHDEQARLFLSEMESFKVLPWVGGAWGNQAHPDAPNWRTTFVRSIAELLDTYPSLAGIHINIEPCPTGNNDFVLLLQEIKAAIPPDKTLSVAAYPPPTRWHPFPEVHWDQPYFSRVAAYADQMAVMMYDTSLRNEKLYRNLMRQWTREAIDWSGDTEILLGLAVYDDADTDYHDPDVENLRNGLAGIHAGLLDYEIIPHQYAGVAIYSEWEMQPDEWSYLKRHFLANESQAQEID